MKLNLCTMLLVSMTLLLACQKESTTPTPEVNPGPDTTNIEEINVPDGFNYESSKKVSFRLTTINTSNEAIKNVLIKIMGINADQEAEQFYSGITNDQGILNIELEVGNHFKSLEVITNYQGLEKVNTFEVIENIESSLQVD